MKKRGVITAHNPMGKKLPDQQNKRANEQLLQYLRNQGYEPHPVTGNYNGHEEDAFEVSDITLKDLEHIGRKFKQKAVMWGDKEITLEN